VRQIARLGALFALAASLLTAQRELGRRIGVYQWSGVVPLGFETDLLTLAREKTTALGSRVFRFYLGARFDYRLPELAPSRFVADGPEARTLVAVAKLPRYRAVFADPLLETVIVSAYPALEYGGAYDDVDLLRPIGERELRAEREQIADLVRYWCLEFGDLPKTFILANNETDEKLMEILNHSDSPELAIENLVAWASARQEAVEQARAEFPDARLRVLNAFEISIVNLRIARLRETWRKSARGEGYSALQDILPRIRCDLISYSAYESTSGPYAGGSADRDPSETYERLRRDLEIIRRRGSSSISARGRELFDSEFVMIGELGFARDRFEYLPTGGVLPRFHAALSAAVDAACPYTVIWQAFDAPRSGSKASGFGLYDRRSRAPRLRASGGGCESLAECLELVFSSGLDAWHEAGFE